MSLSFVGCGNMVTRFLGPADVVSTTSGGAAKSPWTKKRKITINNTSITQLTDFPVAVFLNSSRIDYNACQASGHDVRFFAADGVTALPYELERWFPTGGATSLFWVKIPKIDANSTTTSIVMMYGNPSATDAASPSSVWTSDYKGVYHMVNAQDSTAYANHASAVSNVSFSSTALLGGKAFFDSTITPYLTIPVNGMTTASGTIEAVVEMRLAPAAAQTRYIFSNTSGGGDRIYLAGNNTTRAFYGALGDNTGVASATATYTLNAFTHVSIVYSGCNFTMYFNGVQSDTGSCGTHAGIQPTAKIGNYGWAPQTTADAWDGYIYDLKISSDVKSAGYILAQYRSVTDSYLTFGAEEDN